MIMHAEAGETYKKLDLCSLYIDFIQFHTLLFLFPIQL